MKKIKIFVLKTILTISLIIGVLSELHASHIAGGYINFECTGNPNEYTIRLTLYRDCSGVAAPTSPSDYAETFLGLPLNPPELIWSNDCGLPAPSNGTCGGGIFGGGSSCFSLTQVGSGNEVSQLCDSQIQNSSCNGGNLPGYEEYIYEATAVLPPCDSWTLTYRLCCRNPATNVNNAANADFVVSSSVNTNLPNCNTTPTISAAPQPYVCVGQNATYNISAFEPNGTTKTYSLVSAMSSPTNTVNYSGGYNAGQPIPGITLDPSNGTVEMNVGQQGNFIVVVLIEEFDDDGNVISSTNFDFQVTAIVCQNDAPGGDVTGIENPTGNIEQVSPNEINVCFGEEVCFDVTFTDDDPDDELTVTSNLNSGFPNGTLTSVGTNPITSTVCFEAGNIEQSNNITFLIQDDACPIVGQNNYTVVVNTIECITCQVNINAEIVSCDSNPGLIFEVEGTANLNNMPSDGQLVIENCFGEQVVFDAPFSSSYNFSFSNVPGNGQNCPITATFVNATECEAQNIFNLDLSSGGFIDAGPDVEVCQGETVVLQVQTDLASYSWSPNIQSGVAFSPPVGTNTYTASGVNSEGCPVVDEVVVTVHPNPTVSAGTDVNACEGDQVTLSGSGAATYSWTGGIQNGIPFTPSGSSTYTVTGTTAQGCVGTDQVTVTLGSGANSVIFGRNFQGCQPLEVELNNIMADANSTCTWTFSNGGQVTGCETTFLFNTPGCYDVTLTTVSSSGCESVATAEQVICVYANPVADFDVSPEEITNIFNQANFNNNSTGASEFIWDFGDGSPEVSTTNPVHQYPPESGSYVVNLTAVSEEGCENVFTRLIRVIEEVVLYVPNAFTPDNDLFNEVFQPVFTSGFDPMDYQLLIFNRWGEVMFESFDASVGWDGTYGGKIVPDGTYIWKITFGSKDFDKRQVKTGHVTLIR